VLLPLLQVDLHVVTMHVVQNVDGEEYTQLVSSGTFHIVAHSSQYISVYQDEQLFWKGCFGAHIEAASGLATCNGDKRSASWPHVCLASTQIGFVVVSQAQLWSCLIRPRARYYRTQMLHCNKCHCHWHSRSAGCTLVHGVKHVACCSLISAWDYEVMCAW
jgi:hypothetical protein